MNSMSSFMKNQGENEREREKILKVITRYTQKMKLWEAMDVLINLIVVITLNKSVKVNIN